MGIYSSKCIKHTRNGAFIAGLENPATGGFIEVTMELHGGPPKLDDESQKQSIKWVLKAESAGPGDPMVRCMKFYL